MFRPPIEHKFLLFSHCVGTILKGKAKDYLGKYCSAEILWELQVHLKRNCRFPEGESKNVSEVDNLDLFPASR